MKAGDPFPIFALPDQNGQIVSNQDLAGQKTIVYFYPKDDTTGCTAQACSLRDQMPRFEGFRVIGVSPDNSKSHAKFETKYDLNFTLLADTDHKLAEACGVWVEKSMYGKSYMGVERSTFLVDENGKVARAWLKVKPQDHAAFLLSELGLA